MEGPGGLATQQEEAEAAALAAGRSRRPNAGVSFAARLFAAAEHELDLDLDSEGPADAEDGSGGSEAGPSSVVDLSLLPLSALMRYVRHYSLSVPPECSKARLVTAVEEHFCSTVVDEREVVSNFLRANGHSFDDRAGDARYGGKRRCYDTPVKKPSSSGRRVPRRSLGGGGSSSGYKPNSRAPTYGDMISYALSQLPANEGTLDEICDLIGTQYASQLNQEMESGPRRIPVWKASVRKIINLNYGMRFRRRVAANGTKAVFSFASGKRR